MDEKEFVELLGKYISPKFRAINQEFGKLHGIIKAQDEEIRRLKTATNFGVSADTMDAYQTLMGKCKKK